MARRCGITSLDQRPDPAVDLKEITIPTLVLHGDDDQIVPIDDVGRKSVKLLKKGTLGMIPGGPHGTATVLAEQIDKELLKCIQGQTDLTPPPLSGHNDGR